MSTSNSDFKLSTNQSQQTPTASERPYRFVAVIMAGGTGQRFWPLSTADYPKQFLDLENTGQSLIQSTAQRLLGLVTGWEDVFVVTGERYCALVTEHLPQLPIDNVIVEPQGRDTAPAVALAALTLQAKFQRQEDKNLPLLMGLFASDHRIVDVAAFHETLQNGLELANETKGIVTLGIVPTFASTGYGYIEKGDAVDYAQTQQDSSAAHHVARFVEKPSKPIAEHYLQAGHLWNSGNFVSRLESLIAEFDKYVPELMQTLRPAIAQQDAKETKNDSLHQAFAKVAKISIDYAVMEKTKHAYVLEASFDWDDVGDWVALERLLRPDGEVNTVVGKHIGLEASNNIIYTTDEDDVVVTLGVDDVVIVKRGDTVFVVAKDRVQDIKTLLKDDRIESVKLS